MAIVIEAVSAENLARYLNVAEAQRLRAVNKSINDYGPSHAITDTLRQELHEIRATLNELKEKTQEDTPLEKAAKK